MQTYAVLFEFRTYISEDIEDYFVELNFVPALGMNFYIDDSQVKFPKELKGGGWFKAEDIDYLIKDSVFIVSLKDASEYDFKEVEENE